MKDKTIHYEDLLLTASFVCDVCHGERVLRNQDWVDYFRWHDMVQPNETRIREWWHERRYDYEHLPPRVKTCPGCQGNGRRIHELSLDELRTLLASVTV